MTGSYSFKGTDGRTYIVEYTADEKGFKPIITETSSTDNEDTEFDVDIRINPQIVKTLVGR